MGKHIGLLAALAVAACGRADPYDYEVWDADRDARLTYPEFDRGFEDTWSDWDTDGDGFVSPEELGARWGEDGAFEYWDTNGDGQLSRDELGRGLYDSWDADDSGFLTEEEWGFR